MNLKQTQFDWYDKENDILKCLICGKYFKSLQTHIKIHNISVNEYKEQFGIFKTTPLLAVSILKSRTENTIRMREEGIFVVSKVGIIPKQLRDKANNQLGLKKTNYIEFLEFKKKAGENGRKFLTGKTPWNKGIKKDREIICKNCGEKHVPKHTMKVEFCGISCARKYYWKNK